MNNRKDVLEQAIRAVQSDAPGDGQAAEASSRVWAKLTDAPAVEKIRNCADVQSLAFAYRTGKLAESRRLLVEDHLHECAACRQSYSGAQRPAAWTQPVRPVTSGFRISPQWALAAAVTLAVGISAPWLWTQYNAGPAGSRLVVQSVDGLLVQVSAGGERALSAGAEIGEGAVIRTAANSRAFVRLRDGSVVEMADRAQFSVRAGREDMTLLLDRGNIIVQAAKRRQGHLYVQSPDCRVAVTGTVFAVNRGVKGSRVSVVEGEVRVAQAGHEKVLRSGDQTVTSAYLQQTPVQDEIAWSRNVDQHLALLAEFDKLQQKFQQIRLPGLRYQSRLLPLLPANTVVYASLPNLGEAVGQAQQILEERLQQSPALQEWWKQSGAAAHLPEVLQQVRTISQFLGEEIVLTASVGSSGQIGEPVFLANTVQPGLAEYLKSNRVPSEAPISIQGDLVTFMPSPRRASSPLTGGFDATPFGQRLHHAYQDGAGILLAADMSAIVRTKNEGQRPVSSLFTTTTENVQYLVIERKDVGGQVSNRADLGFRGARQGLFSWLGAPGPMGSLQFVSAEATIVTAAIVKSPAEMLTDFLSAQPANSSGKGLQMLEQALNLRLREDLAQPLGTEFLFAVDGPVLPTPSWKVILEVNDVARLQHSLATVIERYNDEARKNGQKLAELASEQVGDRAYYVLRLASSVTPEVHYTYADGYLIAAPSTALVKKAIATRDSGMTFARGDKFASLLPPDRQTNFSALAYHNLAPLANPIVSQLQGSQALTPQQRETMNALATQAKPSLVYAYATPDHIQVASARDFFGLDLQSIVLGGLFSRTGANKAASESVH